MSEIECDGGAYNVGECDKCGLITNVLYAPEYGANFCHPCAVNPRDLEPS